jgi:hypothetical protein
MAVWDKISSGAELTSLSTLAEASFQKDKFAQSLPLGLHGIV